MILNQNHFDGELNRALDGLGLFGAIEFGYVRTKEDGTALWRGCYARKEEELQIGQ